MGYYDDWVEPNAFFPTRGRYESRRRTAPRGSKHHIKGGCGVEVRLVDDPKEVTCQNCLKALKEKCSLS